MRSLLIVVAEPTRQVLGSGIATAIEADVGPLAQHGLDEALRLSIGARCVRPRAVMAQSKALAGVAEAMRSIAGAVIREQCLDGDALLGEPDAGAACEGRTSAATLVWEDLGVGNPREVIHGHVDELPAHIVTAV